MILEYCYEYNSETKLNHSRHYGDSCRGGNYSNLSWVLD